MGGNLKDADTDPLSVERSCQHCGASFEEVVHYAPKHYCADCKNKFSDPKYLETSVTLDLTETGLIAELHFQDVSPEPTIPIRITGPQRDCMLGLGSIVFESDTGKYKSELSFDNEFSYWELREETAVMTVSPDGKSEFKLEETDIESDGDLRQADRISVTVTFCRDDLASCSDTLTTEKLLSRHI